MNDLAPKTDGVTEFAVTLVGRMKHAALYAACEKLAEEAIQTGEHKRRYGGQSILARMLNVNICTMSDWINLKGYPRYQKEPEKRSKVESVLFRLTGKLLDDLFPESLREAIDGPGIQTKIEVTRGFDQSQLGRLAARQALELPSPGEKVDREIIKERIEEVLKTLTYREREVIKLRYGLENDHDHTLEEVARILKVTRERVRQIEIKALNKLKNPVRMRRLESLL